MKRELVFVLIVCLFPPFYPLATKYSTKYLIKMSSFERNGNIYKKEDESYYVVSGEMSTNTKQKINDSETAVMKLKRKAKLSNLIGLSTRHAVYHIICRSSILCNG